MKKFNDLDPRFTRRAIVAGGVGSLVWAGLSARLLQLQVFENEAFIDDALENSISYDPHPPKRGKIYDRFGETLATHRTSTRVSITREQISDVSETLDLLSRLLPINDARRARVVRELATEERFIPVIVWDDLPYADFARLSAHRPFLPTGVSVELAQTRSYPGGRFLAHVLGYVARANARDLERLTEESEDPETRRLLRRIFKHPDMRVGRYGLEFYADEWLRGTPGQKRFVKNAEGRVIRALPDDETAPKPGKDVWLTIDAGLQRTAVERFGEESGAAVVMDVRNGDVLALASTPAYNPDDFVNGISTSDYEKLRTNERSPLYHKAYEGKYPPGSTFKMVVAAAALDAGVISPEERISCRGKYPFGGRDFHCWKRSGHGPVNMHEAIKSSCDTYFYEIARRLGVERLAKATREFGFGERFELGITGGARGTVPDDAWKRAARGEPWYEGETLNYGIGQGYLNATPLQLAVMTARLARADGAKIRPRLIGQGPRTPSPIFDGTLPFRSETLQRMRDAMFGVTSEPGGTALRSGDLGMDGLRLAGKTGTAQVRRITVAERAAGVIRNEDLPWNRRDHALFVCYAPVVDPIYACSVVVEHGGGGSAVAAPIARDIMKAAFERDSANQPRYLAEKKVSSSGGEG